MGPGTAAVRMGRPGTHIPGMDRRTSATQPESPAWLPACHQKPERTVTERETDRGDPERRLPGWRRGRLRSQPQAENVLPGKSGQQ